MQGQLFSGSFEKRLGDHQVSRGRRGPRTGGDVGESTLRSTVTRNQMNLTPSYSHTKYRFIS